MLRLILFLAVIGVTIYAVIDCLRTPEAQVKALPKAIWIVAILFAPLLGGVLWLVTGRSDSGPSRPARRPRTLAPDDDPDFLRSIDPPRPAPSPEDRPETTD
jgi:hypothetical protein